MNIEFRKSFIKDIKHIKKKSQSDSIKEIIDEIEKADNLNEIQNIKMLKGDLSYFRIRLGNYRLGFKLIDDTVIFVRFLHRKDIYKYFP